MEPEQAFGELGLNRHSIRFTSCIQLRLPGTASRAMDQIQLILNSYELKTDLFKKCFNLFFFNV